MEKETSKYFKFPTIDRVQLKQAFYPEINTVFICKIWTPKDPNKDSYLWVSSTDLSLFDRIETKLLASEVQLEDIYRIERDFLTYQLVPDVFLYE